MRERGERENMKTDSQPRHAGKLLVGIRENILILAVAVMSRSCTKEKKGDSKSAQTENEENNASAKSNEWRISTTVLKLPIDLECKSTN